MSAKPYIAPNPASKPIGAFFRWEIPGEAVGVHLSLNVIELLERDAARAGEKMAAGVLLGRTHHGRELTLTVEHYESATTEHGASESPFSDPYALKAMLDRWRPGRSRMSVLGFYRSCAEETTLNTTDLAAVQATLDIAKTGASVDGVTSIKDAGRGGSETAGAATHAAIQDPERIFLLIEPRAGRLSTASLFLARKGVVVCQSPRMPFNRAELAKTGPAAESQTSDYQAPAYTARETAAPNEKKPVAAPKGKLHWLRRWQWAVMGLCFLPLALSVYVSLRGNQIVPHIPTVLNSSSDSPLGLKLDRSGAAWKLSWDAEAPGVREAVKGRLLITDGVMHRDLELTPSDLHGGTIIYAPVTDDVVLQLQVDAPGSDEPLSASVRTVGGGASSLPSTSSASASSPVVPPSQTSGVPPLQTSGVPPLDENTLRQDAARGVPPPLAISIPEKNAPLSKPVQAKTVQAPPVPSRTSIAKAAEVPSRVLESEPKAKTTQIAAASSPSPRSSTPSRAIAQSPAPASRVETETVPILSESTHEPTSVAPEEKSADRSNAIEVARLVSREDPTYPESAKELGLAGTVEVHFTIGKDGQVHDVSVVKGFSELGQAAIEAVRKWRYNPAKVDGVPTESEASAVFVFKRN